VKWLLLALALLPTPHGFQFADVSAMTRIFDETAEATGFKETWNGGESKHVSSTIDPNETVSGVTGAQSHWGDDCLEFVSTGENAYVTHELGDSTTDHWLRLEIIVASESLGDWAENVILVVEQYSPAWAMIYKLHLYQDGSGDFVFQLAVNHTGSGSSNYESLSTISLDTPYRVELMWDVTSDAWGWRSDGVDQPNNVDSSSPITSDGTLTSTYPTNLDAFSLGPNADWGMSAATTFYIDNFTYADDDWIGAESSTQEGTGALSSQAAQIAGAGSILGKKTGTGSMQSQASLVSGAGAVLAKQIGTGRCNRIVLRYPVLDPLLYIK